MTGQDHGVLYDAGVGGGEGVHTKRARQGEHQGTDLYDGPPGDRLMNFMPGAWGTHNNYITQVARFGDLAECARMGGVCV